MVLFCFSHGGAANSRQKVNGFSADKVLTWGVKSNCIYTKGPLHENKQSNSLLCFDRFSPDRDEWKRFRSPMTKNSLNSKKMRGAFTEGINDIATDFADFVATLRNADTHVVSDVFTEGVKFSLEGTKEKRKKAMTPAKVTFPIVMGLFVYGKRLDCMEATVQPEYQDFLDSVRKILENYNALRLSYGLHKKFKTSTWRANQEGWNGSVKFNEKLVAECESRLRGQLPAAGGRPYYATCLMEQMFSDGLLTRREAVLNAMDMFVAGIYAVSLNGGIARRGGGEKHVFIDSLSRSDRLSRGCSITSPAIRRCRIDCIMKAFRFWGRVKMSRRRQMNFSGWHCTRTLSRKDCGKRGRDFTRTSFDDTINFFRLSSVYPVNFRVLDNDIDLLDYNIPANVSFIF